MDDRGVHRRRGRPGGGVRKWEQQQQRRVDEQPGVGTRHHAHVGDHRQHAAAHRPCRAGVLGDRAGRERVLPVRQRARWSFGRTINFKYLDDGYNPTNTASLTRQLVLQDSVYAMFDALGTPTHLAVVDYLNQQKVPDLFVASGCNCWNNVSAHPYTFGWQPDYTIEGKILGNYVKQTYAGKKVGYFAQGPNDEFGDDGVRGLNDVLQNSSVTVVNPVQYYAPTTAGAMGVKAEMAAMQAAGVQVVVSFSIPVFTATMLASAASIGYHPTFVVSNVGADLPTLTAILTGGSLGVKLPAALLIGMTSDYYLPLVSDTSNAWITLFKGIATQYAPSLPWDGNVLYGLASAYTFVQALRAAGQNPSRADIVHAIENGHFNGPGLAPFGFSASDHLGTPACRSSPSAPAGPAASSASFRPPTTPRRAPSTRPAARRRPHRPTGSPADPT